MKFLLRLQRFLVGHSYMVLRELCYLRANCCVLFMIQLNHICKFFNSRIVILVDTLKCVYRKSASYFEKHTSGLMLLPSANLTQRV